MPGAYRSALILAGFLGTLTGAAAAQEFQPPSSAGERTRGGLRLDLIGFSTRVGAELNGGGSFVVGSAFDVAELGSPNVRLRPSIEYSGAGTRTALHVAAEVIYRFQPDQAPAIPYFGLGVGFFSRPSADQQRLWINLVMGFEIEFRSSFNWLFEYHALDRLGRHRFLVGLATRGGGD